MGSQRLALTSGEPAGIGPDLAIMQAQHNHPYEVIVLGCPDLLQQRAETLSIQLNWQILTLTDLAETPPEPAAAGTIKILPISGCNTTTPGQLNKDNARYVLNILDGAIQGCQTGLFDAMVTAPVQKSVLNDAGIPFSGHTEYLADSTNTPKVVMMLATPSLRVALVTTHLPLRDVADAITESTLTQVSHILNTDLQRFFGIQQPRILVAGLNPHAGENGHLGDEELRIINPTLEKLQTEGINIIGPLPADTLFTPKYLENADAVLAMYHDQGLPVLKSQGFGEAANITLGLPIVRTSVDHGTALDLAGTGNIDPGSLNTAMQIAGLMAEQTANASNN
ncbi:4-hydroxythreonine-4-phosphate dehydrogenase [BD1-7 clade bacterium]|uniref:4-hydroxythreonine-4-phosphate dehydrogenase n=1 Tax=BD1-7 clade bacterium TaxID=2029982 RepID=A0A5S9QT08_9GAMM|nr:4-hydroxythreonine-4-phosphate dehydrogenase [BD1-7 clade bacterium]CAA0121396.1 4-hydroxythreonine-4-phosphate dehydrogenase [BD1-7 clade bacterium]